MNMKKVLLAGLVVLALTVMPSYASANLLTNPGFETGDISGWTPVGSGADTMYNWGHNGSAWSAVNWWYGGGTQTVAIADPNVLTTIGGWIYDDVSGGETLSGGKYAVIEVQFKDSGGTTVGTWTTGQLTGAVLTDDAWNDFTTQVTPSSYGAGITQARFEWKVDNNGSGSGRGIFDDMIVQPVPEPTSVVLLGCGLLGLRVFTRKKRK